LIERDLFGKPLHTFPDQAPPGRYGHSPSETIRLGQLSSTAPNDRSSARTAIASIAGYAHFGLFAAGPSTGRPLFGRFRRTTFRRNFPADAAH